MTQILLCICQSTWAQVFQPCVVKEYNEELAKTPLAGVEVSADDAGQRVSDAQGKLTLRFLTKNVGEQVEGAKIEKLGYEVFNTDAIAQWNISGEDRPFTIVMCKSERFKKIKDNYNAISSKSYAIQKRKEEKLLEEERRKGSLKEADYKKKLQELQDEFDARSVSVRPYIDHFARIDLSELSDEERIIVKFVKSGKIDSAINHYKRMHLEELFMGNRDSYHKLDEGVQQLEKAKKHCNEQRDSIFAQIRRKNDVLMIQGGKENIALVEKSYEEIADNDTTYLYGLSAYAAYLFGQHRDRESLKYDHLIAKCGEREYHHRLSSMYHGIANAYFGLDENDSAKIYLTKSKDANEKYNKKDSIKYLENLLNYYVMMAQIHYHENDFQNAEKMSEKGLEYSKRLYNIDKKQYESELKMALTFAISFNQAKPDSIMEEMYNLYDELPFSSDDAENGGMELFFGTINIVNQFLSQGKPELAKRQLRNAINRIKPLYDKNEEKYRNLLSTYYFFMGSLYYGEQDFSVAQGFLEKGCQLLELEYNTNQKAQTAEAIVMGLKMLGDIKSKYGYCEIADSLYESALQKCDLMDQKEYVKSNYVRSIVLFDKAMHHIQYENIDFAIKSLESKLRIDSIIQQCAPDTCSPPNDWDGRYALAKLYHKKGLYSDAAKVIVPCLEVVGDETYDANLLYMDLLVKTKEYTKAIQATENFSKLLFSWRKLSSSTNVWPDENVRDAFICIEQNDKDKRCIMQHYKAICFYMLGKEKKAKKIWNSIRNQLPDDVYKISPLKNTFH